MNLYSRILFPRLMDLAMSGENLGQYRRSLLQNVRGDILEIGLGTGLNLAHYPDSVKRITSVDVNPGMSALAQRRAQAAGITIAAHVLSSEQLPMPDHSFDSVVSTWTLCSIPDVARAIAEIHRVLKPGGQFFFIEHGLSDIPSVQVWQHRLTPIQRVIGDGCHLDRDIAQLVRQQFPQVELQTFAAPSLPAIGGYFYKGIALRSLSENGR
jgi:ubiquinone/menaquinone biosynthesis C-methylase UbiE